jgi:hypothetical protein
MDSNALYEKDFYAWIQYHIELLKQGKLEQLDVDILIDELESMGKRDKRELANHFIIWLVTKFYLVIPACQALLGRELSKQSFGCRHYQAELGSEQKLICQCAYHSYTRTPLPLS